jgi:hypothetical protein
MRSKDCEKQKTGRKQRALLKLSGLSRGSRAQAECDGHLNQDEAGKASYSRFSKGLVNFRNYFSRVGECENQVGINDHISDRRYDPTLRPWKRPPRANFFSRVDRCENQFAQGKLQ